MKLRRNLYLSREIIKCIVSRENRNYNNLKIEYIIRSHSTEHTEFGKFYKFLPDFKEPKNLANNVFQRMIKEECCPIYIMRLV